MERVAFEAKEKHFKSRETQGYGLWVTQMLMCIEYLVISIMMRNEGGP